MQQTSAVPVAVVIVAVIVVIIEMSFAHLLASAGATGPALGILRSCISASDMCSLQRASRALWTQAWFAPPWTASDIADTFVTGIPGYEAREECAAIVSMLHDAEGVITCGLRRLRGRIFMHSASPSTSSRVFFVEHRIPMRLSAGTNDHALLQVSLPLAAISFEAILPRGTQVHVRMQVEPQSRFAAPVAHAGGDAPQQGVVAVFPMKRRKADYRTWDVSTDRHVHIVRARGDSGYENPKTSFWDMFQYYIQQSHLGDDPRSEHLRVQVARTLRKHVLSMSEYDDSSRMTAKVHLKLPHDRSRVCASGFEATALYVNACYKHGNVFYPAHSF